MPSKVSSTRLIKKYTGLRGEIRHGPKYLSISIDMNEKDFPEEGLKAGSMVRLHAAEALSPNDCVLHLEVCPVLFEKGFVSFPRILDMDYGTHAPSVLIRVKDDISRDEIPYLFRVYIEEGR